MTGGPLVKGAGPRRCPAGLFRNPGNDHIRCNKSGHGGIAMNDNAVIDQGHDRDLQPYFVIGSHDRLFEATRPDFTSYYGALRARPVIEPHEVLPGDRRV